jgi:hypothetical protein
MSSLTRANRLLLRQPGERCTVRRCPFVTVFPRSMLHVGCTGGLLLRAVVGGLLVAVGTAASQMVTAVHGVLIVVAVICASVAAGFVAYANLVKKNIFRVTEPMIGVIQSHLCAAERAYMREQRHQPRIYAGNRWASTPAALRCTWSVFAGSGWFGRGSGGVCANVTRPR